MDVIRITTAGSVDDGKSTLVGRLLYDTRNITKDKLDAIEAASKRKGLDFTDLSLLTDGLIAEREQGITIDVAHIYFSTENRKYIVADTPGHIEYTRNMITGASNADVSLILIDARKGVIEQTRRHFYITSLLGIKQVSVCINKMDMIRYDEKIFKDICNDFTSLSGKVDFEQKVKFIPVAAKDGDNIVYSSLNMPWYNGETLLEFLENTPSETEDQDHSSRFPIQYVIRPQSNQFHDFRGYSGKVISGNFKKGDKVTVLPSEKSSKIKNIYFHNEERDRASVNESLVMTLEDDIDVSRGNMLVKETEEAKLLIEFKATICWLDEQPVQLSKTYLLQHNANRVKVKIASVNSVLDIHTLENDPVKKIFQLNDIGTIEIKSPKPIFAEPYETNPSNGSFILIDESSNNTLAVGFIRN